MKLRMIYAVTVLSAVALAGCGRHDAEPGAKAPRQDAHDVPGNEHEEHERHPRSIHSTIERATGEAPDHTGTEKP